MNKIENVLVLSPHTDDAELSAGATLHRLQKMGVNIDVIVFSYCDDEELIRECEEAFAKLSIHNVVIHNFERRYFYRERQKVLDILIKVKSEKKYDLVFTCSKFDTHQDHKVVYEETVRAFKDTSIWGYDKPRNSLTYNSDIFVVISRGNLSKKIQSLVCYESQKYRTYFDRKNIMAIARTRGSQIDREFAESFELIREVIK